MNPFKKSFIITFVILTLASLIVANTMPVFAVETEGNGSKSEESGETPPLFGKVEDIVPEEEKPEAETGILEEVASVIEGETEQIVPEEVGSVNEDIRSIRECLEILVYFIIPFSIALLGVVKFLTWFRRTFVAI